MTVHRTRQILAAAMLVLGLALVVVGLAGGVWPVSVQFVAGCLLVVLGVLRLRYS